MELAWSAPADASTVTGYQILRRRPGLGESELEVLVANTGNVDTSYFDATATEIGQRHVYRVKAVHISGGSDVLSGWSNYAGARPTAAANPSAPRCLGARAVCTTAQLWWAAPTQDVGAVTGYQILRRRPHLDETALEVLVADTQSTDTSYLDETATETGALHVYRVKAIRTQTGGGTELSGWSNYARAYPNTDCPPQNQDNGDGDSGDGDDGGVVADDTTVTLVDKGDPDGVPEGVPDGFSGGDVRFIGDSPDQLQFLLGSQVSFAALADRAPEYAGFALDVGNDNPNGLWSDGSALWVSDEVDNKLYAYTLWGQRKSGEDKTVASSIDLDGIGSDGTVMYVVDDSGSTVMLRAHNWPAMSRDTSLDITLNIDTGAGTKIAVAGGALVGETTVWASDSTAPKVYAYNLDDPNTVADEHDTRDSMSDIDVSGQGHSGLRGLTSDGDTIWLMALGSRSPNKLLAYKASDLSRDSARDITLDPLNDSADAGEFAPHGVWTDGTTMFVTGTADAGIDSRVFTYRYRDNASVSVSGEPSVGETLTASVSDPDGIGADGVAYQWQQLDEPGGEWADIAGKTDSTYVLSVDDVGRAVRVSAVFVDGARYEESPVSRSLRVVLKMPHVSAGGYHTCALRSDGRVSCTGGYSVLASDAAVPSAGTGRTYEQVTAGAWHSCARKDDGTVGCWGNNDYGQAPASRLPYGNKNSALSYTDVDAGVWHTCGVVSDGTIDCWGRDAHNETGAPAPPDGEHWAQVSAGGYIGGTRTGTADYTGRSCALATDGSIACWGDDSHGVNNISDVTLVDGLTFTAVSVGGAHACAIASDGRLLCWGDSGTDGKRLAPDTQPSSQACLDDYCAAIVASPATQPWDAVSAGTWHTCATTAGQIHCWGDNPLIDTYLTGTQPADHDNHNNQARSPTTGIWHLCWIHHDPDQQHNTTCTGDNDLGQSRWTNKQL